MSILRGKILLLAEGLSYDQIRLQIFVVKLIGLGYVVVCTNKDIVLFPRFRR